MFKRLKDALARWIDAHVRPGSSLARESPASDPATPSTVAIDPSHNGEPILVQREVLDVNLAVIGHDFALREDLRSTTASCKRPIQDFLDRTMLEQVFGLDTRLFKNRICHLQVQERNAGRLVIEQLPVGTSVLIAPSDPLRPAGPETRAFIGALRASGREAWLDDCIGTPWFASLARLSNGAVTRLARRLPAATANLATAARQTRHDIRLAAWDVATCEDFEMARGLGCQRFCGPFVLQRQNWHGNKMMPQTLNVAQLISSLDEKTDLRTIAKVIRQDLALSYRLVRYLNSAALATGGRIASIEQGLLVLGQIEIRRWLTLIMLSGGRAGNPALTSIALTRARFLELVGEGRLTADQCQNLFVLGLFSILDLALKLPLEAAIKPLNLPDQMLQALLHRQGPLGPYLTLADACEQGDTDSIIRHALALGLTTKKVNARQMAALNWVAEITAPETAGAEAATPIYA